MEDLEAGDCVDEMCIYSHPAHQEMVLLQLLFATSLNVLPLH